MGLDSLGAVELSRRLKSYFGVELSSTLVFNRPSIRDMSEYIYGLVSLEGEVDGEVGHPVNSSTGSEAIAGREWSVVGMSCRFPGGMSGPGSFWELMSVGKETSSGVPYGRWDSDAFLAGLRLSKEEEMRASCGSFVMDMECFDARFFGISLAEASAMDPQQRALMECTHLAFMDVGYTMDGLRGLNCGVFVAVSGGGSASRRVLESAVGVGMQETSAYDATSSTPSIAAGRISYVFDLVGPNNTFDTA